METNSTGYPNDRFIFDEWSSSDEYFESGYERERKLCCEIKRLNIILDYNGCYIAFLLGMTTEKEFKKITKEVLLEKRGYQEKI